MSKEEILEKYHVHQAMDVFAKEVAIGFNNYVRDNYQTAPYDGRSYIKRLVLDELTQWPKVDELDHFTTEQLYQLYLNKKHE